MRGDRLRAEMVFVPVGDEDRVDAVVGRPRRLEPNRSSGGLVG